MMLATSLLLVSVGWLVERRNYSKQLTDTLDDAGIVSSTISTAVWTNLIYSELDTKTDEENARRRKTILHTNILFLYTNLDHANTFRWSGESKLGHYSVTRDERTLSIKNAGKSLTLLGVSTVDDYRSSFFDWQGTDLFFTGVLDREKNDLTDEFKRFVKEALDISNSSAKTVNTHG